MVLRKTQHQSVIFGQIGRRSNVLGRALAVDNGKGNFVAVLTSQRDLEQVEGLVRIEVDDLVHNVSATSSLYRSVAYIARFLD